MDAKGKRTHLGLVPKADIVIERGRIIKNRWGGTGVVVPGQIPDGGYVRLWEHMESEREMPNLVVPISPLPDKIEVKRENVPVWFWALILMLLLVIGAELVWWVI